MPPAARVNDFHVCPIHGGGPIDPNGVVDILVEGSPAARAGDLATCPGPKDLITQGSGSVLMHGLPAARMTDKTGHGGTVLAGAALVLVGGPTVTPTGLAEVVKRQAELARLKKRIERRQKKLKIEKDILDPPPSPLDGNPLIDIMKKWLTPKGDHPGPAGIDEESERQGIAIAKDIARELIPKIQEGIDRDQKRIEQIEAEDEGHRKGQPVTPSTPDPDLDKPIIDPFTKDPID